MKTIALDPELVCHPAVCAVHDEYHIMVPVHSDMLMAVRVGDETYYDESNGIMRSSVRVHRIVVPMAALDRAAGYTVIYLKMIERKPYFPTTEPPVELHYDFRPLTKRENIHIYQLADTHGIVEASARAANYFGDDLDLLVLNGDIADHSGTVENICIVYRIASLVAGGTVPCVFSRGNHDLRGACAENLSDYMPNESGRSYYDFRVGCIWGILIDCGEDKRDDCDEYGHTVCCEPFRRRQTEYIRQKIADSAHSYAAPGVDYRLVISHVPFTHNITESDAFGHHPFNIEIERYTEWARLLGEYVHPQLMFCGHMHELTISLPGSSYDDKGQPCPVLVGSKPEKRPDGTQYFVGMAVTLNPGAAEVCFTDSEGKTLHRETLKI